MNKLIYEIYKYILLLIFIPPVTAGSVAFYIYIMTKIKNYIFYLAFIPHISAGPDVIYNLHLY